MSYEGQSIRAVPMPKGVPVAGGWVRSVWHLKSPGGFDLTRLELPRPPTELVITRMLLTIVPRAQDQLDVVVMTDDDGNPHNLAFVSLVLQQLVRSAHDAVLIEDLPHHPVLRLARDERQTDRDS